MKESSQAVAWSVRLYALLLAVLPADFRREYHELLLQTFRDLCRDSFAAHGAAGLAAVWLHALADLLGGAAGEWGRTLRSGGHAMRRSTLGGIVAGGATVALILLLGVLGRGAGPRLPLILVLATVALVTLLAPLRRPRAGLVGANDSTSPAAVGSSAPIPVEPQPAATSARRVLVGAVSALALLLFLLLAYLRLTLPDALAAGNVQPGPRFQVWLGLQGERDAVLAILAAVLGAYVAVAVLSSRRPTVDVRPWLTGVVAGAVAGLLAGAVGLTTDLIARNPRPTLGSADVLPFLLYGAPIVAGLLAGRATGQAVYGLLAGFWSAAVFAMVLATGGLATDLALANRLVQTVWDGNQDCRAVAGSALAACSIGDDLDGFFLGLLLLPPLGLALGSVGGLLGRALAVAGSPADRAAAPTVIAPLLFSGLLLLVLLAQVGGNFW